MDRTQAVLALKEKILAKRPILAGLFKDYAHVPIGDYSRALRPSAKAVDAVRKREFIGAVRQEAGRHFPDAVAGSIAKQLESQYLVSTAEHHGPLTHPFFVHSNLLAADRPLENVIILAVGNVSLNNSSYPRGLIFHSADGLEHRLPFFPWRERMSAVFGQRRFGRADLQRLYEALAEKVRNRQLSDSSAAAVGEFIEDLYGRPEVLALPDYNSQIVKSNDLLWQKFFSRGKFQPPRLVNLQLENIVIRLLLDHHMSKPTEIHELIFNPEFHRLFIEHADGLPGNFSLREKKGTFLFWHLSPKDGRRQQLWPEDGYLAGDNYRLKLTPGAVAEALDTGQLVPGTFLNLILLSEYYGVKCLGGFSQGTYLTGMHRAYNLMRGRPAGDFDPNHTSGLRSDFVLGYFKDSAGRLHPASGLDLALHHHKDSWGIFSETIGRLTLEQAMAPLFPELYRALYSAGQQGPELTSVSTDDIISYYNLAEKISPCINIPV